MPQEQEIIQQVRCVSHEIRNQLSICDVYSEILKKHLVKENIKNSSIDNALKCIQKAVKLIGNDLIELKTFDNIALHIIDSDKLLRETIELSKVYIQDKNIEILSDIEPDIKIYVDENKLQGCIINIIKNAIEAIPTKGFVKITSKSDGKNLSVKISNNGKAIPAEKQSDIFNQGFKTKKTGSGIGLYLCKKNIEAQNGNIKLLKSTNETTEFEIQLPVKNIS